MRIQEVQGGGQRYTSWVRWRGNLLPLFFALPFGVLALLDWRWLGGLPVACWLGMEHLGLWGNAALKTPSRGLWVGFATDRHVDPIEPHYDVGRLDLSKQGLSLEGDRLSIWIPWSEVQDIRRRPNPHSWVLLGGFVSVETTDGRLDIEPREFSRLSKNRKLLPHLEKELRQAWQAGRSSSV